MVTGLHVAAAARIGCHQAPGRGAGLSGGIAVEGVHVRVARVTRVDDGIVRTLVVEGTENLPLGVAFISSVMRRRHIGQHSY
jgi:hypothetical protein